MKYKENHIVSVWMNYTVGEVFYWRMNRVEVIYPGRLCNNGGCDLKDAVFLYNGKVTTGDVEIHIKASDWNSHGHWHDTKYNDVALHVVMSDDTDSITRTHNGKYIPILNIKDLIERIYGFSSFRQCLPVSSFKCPFAQSTKHKSSWKNTLMVTGIRRLNLRASKYYELLKTQDSEQILYEGIARCLGYEKNAVPFEKLAHHINIDVLQKLDNKSVISMVSIVMGTAGLLPSQINKAGYLTLFLDNNQIDYIERLWSRNSFQKLMDKNDWCFFRIRPVNHPVVRLLALCALIHRYKESGFVTSLVNVISKVSCKTVLAMEKCLIVGNMISGSESVYESGATLGKYKAREIIVNAVLPFLYAYGAFRKDMKLSYQAAGLFHNFPSLQDNYLLKYMRQILMLKFNQQLSAVEQQGLIHLFKNYCRNKDCQHCLLLIKTT